MGQKVTKQTIWHGRIFRYVPLILCISLILFASTTNASSSNTSHFIRPLLEYLFPNSPEETIIFYHGFIRKFAHFTEYAVLAFFASRAFWDSSKEILKRYWYLVAIFLVLLIASIDEINQSFDINRTGSIYDILLDGFGGSIMICSLIIYKFYFSQKKARFNAD